MDVRPQRHFLVGAIAAVLVAAQTGTAARTVAMVPASPVGVWQGPKGPSGDPLTLAIDEGDTGSWVFFLHDPSAGACDGGSGTISGRGVQVNEFEMTFYLLAWDGVRCTDGSWKPLPGSWFRLWALPGTGYVWLDSIDDQEWTGYPICEQDGADPVSGTEVIWGTGGADTINGTKGADLICALGGDDTIWGRGGDDIVIGGDGDDVLYGNFGIDILWGGPDDDILYGGFHSDGVFGNDGDDEVRPQAGHDFGYGGYGADVLDGFFGHDRLEGGPGDDDAWGRNGNDFLLGGTGNDFLSGGNGPNDTVDGEAGSDTCNAETETNCEF